MAEVKWVKLCTDMFDNRKIKHLRKLPEGNSIVLIWVMLLTMAGRCNANGMIFLTETIPYTPKMLADELDFEENTVVLALEALERLNMLEMKEGCYTITGWAEHQNIDRMAELKEYNRQAQQKSRAKKKQLQAVNDMSMTSQHCQDIEEEREEDKEKELDIHSFNLAQKDDLSAENVEKSVENARRSYLQGSLGGGVVLLSREQTDDLLERLSVEEFDKYVGIVRDNELSGKHYRKKTHYQAILDMATADRKLK